MATDNFTKIVDVIREEESFLVASHFLPDGDSVGSSLALARSLIRNGKRVMLFNRDPIPVKYQFLNHADLSALMINDFAGDAAKTNLVVLDCSDFSRSGLLPELKNSFKTLINIDHHVTNEYYGTANLVVPEAAATGEIIYELLRHGHFFIDDHIATALYVAIITDTGSFKFENTTSQTHRIVADLLNYDIDVAAISQRIFDEKPLVYFMILKKALSTLELWEGDRIAALTVSRDLLVQEGADMEILDGMINYTKNIDGVEVGILFFIDQDNEIKVGLRSKNVDVSVIADRFGGGGHVRAAGFRHKGPYHDLKRKTIAAAARLIDTGTEGLGH
ncbi:MAG: bifunctional oligoribonuclease/PAP phosphatase NrnA [Firmicutes bacterium]|jgi:phosphoesterase RecJ-like protein|nr:bifunctional oligoribonuclease/PAP phosphatase NrnA [Bacillota bacterium]